MSNSAKKTSTFGTINFSGKLVNPKRDWPILLFLSVVFILISVGFDVYMYLQISSGNMYVTISKNELVIESLDSSTLQNILNDFENKKANIADLKIDNLVDPSI
jgi:hypothetical protein